FEVDRYKCSDVIDVMHGMIFQGVLKEESGNFFVSPLSVETILAFAQSGCKDATAQEIRAALFLPDDKDQVEVGVKNFLPRIKGGENYALHSANKMYIQEDFDIKEGFKAAATEVYRADLENINFKKPDDAARTMNKWVEERTNSKIQNLINSSDLTNGSRVILINALYFKADWVYKFPLDNTSKFNFYRTSTDVVQVDTMYISHCRYQCFDYCACKELNAKFLELPFTGGDASMVIILPNEKEGLAALENQIESVFRPRQLHRGLIDVSIPKFRIESRICFKQILQNLGVHKAFDEKEADLSGIAGDKGDLVIDDVVQKTFVDVSEEGVEAAAATFVHVAIPLSGIEGEIPNFIADHPFIFYIKIKGVIVFAGRVTDPEQ
ncbi:antichymotrypsin-2-like, partial [Asbolus verrucosus]